MTDVSLDTREFNLVVQLLTKFVEGMQPMPVSSYTDAYAYPLAASVANDALEKMGAPVVELKWKEK